MIYCCVKPCKDVNTRMANRAFKSSRLVHLHLATQNSQVYAKLLRPENTPEQPEYLLLNLILFLASKLSRRSNWLLRNWLVGWRNGTSNNNLRLNLAGRMALKVWLSRVHTNTLLAQQVDKKRAGLIVLV